MKKECDCATAGAGAGAGAFCAGWGRRGPRRPRDRDDRMTMPADDDDNWWALLALALVVATAAGNILVCLAIAWERRLQNVTNYFLMSLAITDLMVAVLVMPLGILTLVKGKLRYSFLYPLLTFPGGFHNKTKSNKYFNLLVLTYLSKSKSIKKKKPYKTNFFPL